MSRKAALKTATRSLRQAATALSRGASREATSAEFEVAARATMREYAPLFKALATYDQSGEISDADLAG